MNFKALTSDFYGFGIIQSIFDPKISCYETKEYLKLYSIFLTIVIQSFNAFCLYYRFSSISEIYLDTSKSFTSIIILLADCTCWILINSCTMISIITFSETICKVLNINIKFLKSNGNFEIPLIQKVYKYVMIFGTPSIDFIFFGSLSKLTFISMLNHYALICQLLYGHLLEQLLLEVLVQNFKLLQSECQIKSDRIQNVIKIYYVCVDSSKKTTKTFALNKVVGLVMSLVSMPIYWFDIYQYVIGVTNDKRVIWYKHFF